MHSFHSISEPKCLHVLNSDMFMLNPTMILLIYLKCAGFIFEEMRKDYYIMSIHEL